MDQIVKSVALSLVDQDGNIVGSFDPKAFNMMMGKGGGGGASISRSVRARRRSRSLRATRCRSRSTARGGPS